MFTLALAAACQAEPSADCDDTRVTWGFENHEISAADDVSADEGLQIDLTLFTALPAGNPARLTLTNDDGTEMIHPQTATVSDSGSIVFESVNVPAGNVLFLLTTENDCREVESRQRRFVIDGDRDVVCELEFVPQTREIASEGTLRSYAAADDQDGVTDGLQAAVRVFTGRVDMSIRLLLLNRDTGSSQISAATTDATGAAVLPTSFDDGEQAIRALCSEGINASPQSTATFAVLVDTVLPDCALISPTARLGPGDDIDGDITNGIQFLAIAQTSDESNAGLEASFSVNGGTPQTSEIGSSGQSTAIVTVPSGAGGQTFDVDIPDLAGNVCRATAMF